MNKTRRTHSLSDRSGHDNLVIYENPYFYRLVVGADLIRMLSH